MERVRTIDEEARDLRRKLQDVERAMDEQSNATRRQRDVSAVGRGHGAAPSGVRHERSRSPHRPHPASSSSSWSSNAETDDARGYRRQPNDARESSTMGARAVAPSDASSSAAKSVEPPLKIAIEKPAPMEIKDPVVKRRNMRLFGVLQGHLKKAGDEFHESGSLKRQEEIDRRVTERLESSRHEVALQLEQQAADQRAAREAERAKQAAAEAELRARQTELRRLLKAKEDERQRVLMENELRAHFHARSQFIRTRGALRIYWAPALHNEYTRGLLARSADEHERELDRMIAAQLQRFTTNIASSSTSAATPLSASASASTSNAAESASGRPEIDSSDADDEAIAVAAAEEDADLDDDEATADS